MCVYLYFLSVKHLVSRLRQGVCVCVCSLSVKLLVGRLCQGVCVLSAPCGPTFSGSVCVLVCVLTVS